MQVRSKPFRRLAGVLVDPSGTARATTEDPDVGAVALALITLALALGAAALPGQLAVLNEALAPVGQLALDVHHQAMQSGLRRVIVADRLVLSPTVVLAAGLIVMVSDPMLALPSDRRRSLWAIVLLGLAPLLVQEIGELTLTYLAAPGKPTPGDAVNLGSRFVTGPLLLWRGEGVAPHWLEVVNSRLNLVTLWCVLLWVIGLRVLDGDQLRSWHIAVPLTSLGMAGVITWIMTPLVMAALLGKP
ncbi:MAG: hypothetical protein JSW71_02060 [Gemmatimonadota bacterium]|nr:MAG: hypothetical protein JSW71_02060 [Gemmatimonadota bacterium]